MEYIPDELLTNDKQRILCCECGVAIEPNPANMCVGCIRARIDISEGIPKQGVLYFCRGCERYLQPPADWIQCTLESRELLALCLKKLKGLNRVKLIDAGFVWTEPHSKRIKVKLTIQGEVVGGAVLQQVFIVEFTVTHHMCDDCHRSEAQDYWRAMVQIRQKSENKKTFYYLEQLILKHKAHEHTLGIKPVHGGLDFFYTSEAYARKMIDFVQSVLPCKYQHSKKLISHDIHSNTYNYKFTFSVDIVPISKDSVVCLPKKLAQQLGGMSQISLVYRVTNSVHLIDPFTAQIAEVSSAVYYRTPFNTILNPKQLILYIVMDIEVIRERDRVQFPGQGALSYKHVLADVWLVKESELGIVEPSHVRTHLGHVLKTGDHVYGYNIQDTNVNDSNFDKLDHSNIPMAILVKKYYGSKAARRRHRNWKLKHMTDVDLGLHEESDNDDYNAFLDDLEEDPSLRQNVAIYKNPRAEPMIPVDGDDDTLDPSAPRITLEEMLDDLHIDDVEMAE
ncbi:60S ribosomal export protein NMD3 [Chrysoperla carnea]|uniref:60S ribosomal export protein NMD3 n=1 Tax=Chrysoperla carnea TaxID=189513 RepID=UPI001D07A70B|nr:60S ribosomal export protein NMD3 [Chrysoperla carnea]